MYEFKKTSDPENRFDISEISVKVIDGVTLTDLLQEFQHFLTAAGFYLKGNLEIVEESEVVEDEQK